VSITEDVLRVVVVKQMRQQFRLQLIQQTLWAFVSISYGCLH